MPSLILLRPSTGVTASKTTVLTGEPQMIGRDGKCRVLINDNAVSREHARVWADGGTFYIEDLKSHNRTLVNNRVITAPTRLKPNDRIRICDFEFEFRDDRLPLPDSMRKDVPESNAALGAAPSAIVAGAQSVPDYMAPEQINERADSPPSEATDLHSVGVILFHMLTGELPFPPGIREGDKLEAIAKRRFVSCEELCRAKGYSSRLAPLVDRVLRGGEYRQARFLLRDLPAASTRTRPATPRAPTATEPFVVTAVLFEDRLTETFTATGAVSDVRVNLRLVKPQYDSPEIGRLVRDTPPTPADAPPGVLRRFRVGRGTPVPVRSGTRFSVDGSATSGGCLAVVEEYAGDRTLMAAIADGAFLGNDEAVLRVAVPLLQTLDYAHARGALHARLTPFCVFVTDDGVRVEGLRLPSAPGPRPTVGLHAAAEEARMGDSGDPDGGMSTIETTQKKSPQDLLQAAPSDRLHALLEISTALARTLELDALLEQIADTLLTVFRQADRCFIVLLDADSRPYSPAKKTRRPGADSARFSKTIVRRTVVSMLSSLHEDAAGDPSLGAADSIADAKIRSVMCAPLGNAKGQPLGAIQIDTQDRAKKFATDDLNLLASVAHLASVAVERARMHEAALAAEKERRELELSRQLLRRFLPRGVPAVHGYEFSAHHSAAGEVGGDYYDFVRLPGDRLAVLVADVAGKNVPAALLAARLGSEAKAALLAEAELPGAVARLNDAMIAAGLEDRFIALTVALLDPHAHRVTVVNAGHERPKLFRGATGEVLDAISLDESEVPLGVVPGLKFKFATIDLEQGDVFALYTDGVTDAVNPAGEAFGEKRVERYLRPGQYDPPDAGGPAATGERLAAAVKRHAAGRSLGDDLVVVCFGRSDAPANPLGGPGTAKFRPLGGAP